MPGGNGLVARGLHQDARELIRRSWTWSTGCRSGTPTGPEGGPGQTEKKEEYANYLDVNLHLVAITASVNRSRGEKGPEKWRPPEEVFWCEYALYWSAVKTKWELTMSGEEANAVKEMLDTCPGEVRVIEIKG